MHRYRTHNAGALRAEHAGQTVRLSGWMHMIRDKGGIQFLVIRDHHGSTQVVVEPGVDFIDAVKATRVESTVRIDGVVRLRPEGQRNPEMSTGDIEIEATAFELLAASDVLPFPIVDDPKVGESIRLEHRFLDLRRKVLHDNIVLRSQVTAHVRRELTEMGFLEMQTPILTSSSPEGARDYLVPSRVHPGRFYALPQAPQQFKQLLMTSGFDRYIQIAPCFRDEDGRADRSPGEFYQIDLEMAYVTQDDVFEALERLMVSVFTTFSDRQVTPAPFPRLAYADAMARYGSDKPDLRFGLEIADVTDVLRGSDTFFATEIEGGSAVRAIVVPDVADKPRRWFDDIGKYMTSLGRHGVIWLGLDDDQGKVRGSVKKFFEGPLLGELRAALPDLQPGGAVLFFHGKEHDAATLAGWVRVRLGDLLDLRDPTQFNFCWIVDYPMFEADEETGAIQFSHNPFSMPQGGMDALENMDPLDILAWQYDLVCNGNELSSGAIRNHRPDIMVKAFELAGYTADDVRGQFGALFRAFQYGPPPHGGLAPGLDRIVMLLAGADSLRDVVTFPMTIKAQDLLMGAPATVSQAQLDELHLALVPPKG
jgi:aspartyl-tRNA synthetase